MPVLAMGFMRQQEIREQEEQGSRSASNWIQRPKRGLTSSLGIERKQGKSQMGII